MPMPFGSVVTQARQNVVRHDGGKAPRILDLDSTHR
jgi:ureidoglycolate hydrolase